MFLTGGVNDTETDPARLAVLHMRLVVSDLRDPLPEVRREEALDGVLPSQHSRDPLDPGHSRLPVAVVEGPQAQAGDVQDMPPATGNVPAEPLVGDGGDGQGEPERNSGGDNEEPDGLEGLICQTFVSDCTTAIHIAGCESGFDADGRLDGVWAQNGISFGLFALHRGHGEGFYPGGPIRWPDMFLLSADGLTPNWAVAEWNVSHAYELQQEQGWWPWQCW